MTQQTPTRSFLKHSQPLLTKCLQAALIAAPLLLAAAPSEASNGVSVSTTVNGFTGVFAPGIWAKNPTTGTSTTSAAVNATTITLFKSLQNSGSAAATITLNTGVWDALRPSANAGRILGWKATGLADFTKSGGTNATNTNARYSFTAKEPNINLVTLAPSSSGDFTDKAFEIGESYLDLPFEDSDQTDLRFQLSRVGNTGVNGASATGIIDDFVFTAEYAVPGPLPVVGAAAAFAWSRRLRKRLNSARTLA